MAPKTKRKAGAVIRIPQQPPEQHEPPQWHQPQALPQMQNQRQTKRREQRRTKQNQQQQPSQKSEQKRKQENREASCSQNGISRQSQARFPQAPTSQPQSQRPRSQPQQQPQQKEQTHEQNSADETFGDTVSQILSSEENRESDGLLGSEIDQLAQLCSLQQQRQRQRPSFQVDRDQAQLDHPSINIGDNGGGFAAVDADLVGQLVAILEKQMRAGCNVHLIAECIQILDADTTETTNMAANRSNSVADQWLRGAASSRVNQLRLALQAASILLFIMATPAISPKVISVDAVEASISLLRHHMSQNVLPALNHVGHLMESSADVQPDAATAVPQTSTSKKRRHPSSATSKTKSAQSSGNPSQHPLNGESVDTSTSTSSRAKQRRSAALDEAIVKRELDKVYRKINATMELTVVMMERLEGLVKKISLEDQQIFHLAAVVLTTLELQPPTTAEIHIGQKLQHAAVCIVTTIFRKHRAHRSVIIEDLFPIMLRMPRNKKNLRTFPVRRSSVLFPHTLITLSRGLPVHSSTSISGSNSANTDGSSGSGNSSKTWHDQQMIQTITALLLSCLQTSVERPLQLQQQQQQHGSEMNDSLKSDIEVETQQRSNCESSAVLTKKHGYWIFKEGLKNTQQLCDDFVQQLLGRCARKGEDGGASAFRPVLNNLVDDLLALMLVPEYPAAEMLLMTIVTFLSRDLMRANKSSRSLHAVESTFLNTAFDVLGRICATEAKILAFRRDRPVKLPASATTPAADGEKLDCYCVSCTSADAMASGGTGGSASPDVCSAVPSSNFDPAAEAESKLMLDCDRCHHWYHGGCVGLSRETIPAEWFCDGCQLGRIIEYERDRFANRGESWIGGARKKQTDDEKFIDNHFAMRRLCLDYLSRVARQGEGAQSPFVAAEAYQFHMASWMHEAYDAVTKAHNVTPGERILAATVPTSPLLSLLSGLWSPSESNQTTGEAGYKEPSMVSSSTESPSATSSAKSSSLSGMLHCLSEEGRSRMMIHLATTKSGLLRCFKSQVEFMVNLMGSETSPSIRKLAVKAIERITDSDPKLMLYQFLKKAVIQRVSDESISVREAAVSLVGAYAVHTPAVANSFHYAFLTGMRDPGLSVRKRTVKILQNILSSNPSYEGRAEACSELLKLAANPEEDDMVRDLIHALFLKIWLEDGNDRVVCTTHSTPKQGYPMAAPSHVTPSSLVKDVEHIDGVQGNYIVATPVISTPGTAKPSATPSPPLPPVPISASTRAVGTAPLGMNTPGSMKIATTTGMTTTTLKDRAQVAAEQMVEVVKEGNDIHDLTVLMQELLSGTNDADKSRRLQERQQRRCVTEKHCTMLLESLIDILISMEEKGPRASKTFGKDIAAVVRTIQVFSDVSPSAVLHHVDTLLPYLKADNGVSTDDESAIVASICKIFAHISNALCASELERLASTSLADDLIAITYKFGKGAIAAAVEALCALAHHRCCRPNSPLRHKLVQLAKTFHGFLAKHKDRTDFAKVNVKLRTGVQRALSVLGSICKNHHLPPPMHTASTAAMSVEDHDQEFTWSTIPVVCERIFLAYIKKLDHSTKCAALRALGSIFITNPREMFIMDQRGLIAKVMSPAAHATVQLEALRVWREVLLAEEARIEGDATRDRLKAGKVAVTPNKGGGSNDKDATLFGGVLNGHAAKLFALTQSVHPRVRFAAVELVGQLLRQGQINPIETMPYLLALQGDVDEDVIRTSALKLIMIEGKKRPDMLRQRVGAGVKEAYKFQRTVYPNKESISALVKIRRLHEVRVECVFGSVFEECIRSSQKQRHGLFRSLLCIFDVDSDKSARRRTDSSTSKSKSDSIRTKKHEKNGKRHGKNTEDGTLTAGAPISNIDLPLLGFVCQVLAHLPYTSPTDPLYIIHHISSKLIVEGASVLDRFGDMLRPLGLVGEDELDNTAHGEDALEVAAKASRPRNVQSIAALFDSNFDRTRFALLCCEASVVTLLLRLKGFLQKTYNLSESRILGFDPQATDRLCDRISSKAHMFAFDSQLPLSKVPKDNEKIRMTPLVRQYAEFRGLMRSEAALNSSSSGSDIDDDDDYVAGDRRGGGGGDGKQPRKRKRLCFDASTRTSYF